MRYDHIYPAWWRWTRHMRAHGHACRAYATPCWRRDLLGALVSIAGTLDYGNWPKVLLP